jgi:hemolysin III
MSSQDNQDLVKPKLRGVLHLIGALIALPAVVALYRQSSDALSFASLIYSISLVGLLATSATYHVPDWSPKRRGLLRKIDHAMIFVLIGGSFLPFLVALGGKVFFAFPWLIALGTLVGVLRSLFMEVSSKAVRAASYGSLGLAGLLLIPSIYQHLGPQPLTLVLVGGAIYGLGATTYARKTPNLVKGIFEYHELFHLCVNIAAGLHFWAIWGVVSA